MSYLVKNGCQLLQGYFFSRPLYPEDVPNAMLQNHLDMIQSGMSD